MLEVSECHVKDIIGAYEQNDVACMVIGHSVGSCGPEAQASYVLASISEKKLSLQCHMEQIVNPACLVLFVAVVEIT